MPRIRTIKPEFWSDEKVMGLTHTTRLLFIGLWNFADDAGRMRWSPLQIKAQVFPGGDVTEEEVELCLRELERAMLILGYRSESGQLLQVKSWHHQKINRPLPSKMPAPCGITEDSLNPAVSAHGGREGRKGGSGAHAQDVSLHHGEWWLESGGSAPSLRGQPLLDFAERAHAFAEHNGLDLRASVRLHCEAARAKPGQKDWCWQLLECEPQAPSENPYDRWKRENPDVAG